LNYKSIKHSFLIILIATTIVGCAGNSVQPPASQYQTSSESFDSPGDTSSIDFEAVGGIIITTAVVAGLVAATVVAPEVMFLIILPLLMGGG